MLNKLKIIKNRTKTEKAEEKSNASTVTNTKATGNSITTSITHNSTKCYTTTSETNTTQIVHNSTVHGFNELDSIRNFNRNTNLDRITYKGTPPRSAFTSIPLTTKSASVISKTAVDAKPFPTTSHSIPKLPIQEHLANSNNMPASTAANELQVKFRIKVKNSTKFYDNQNSVVPIYKTRSKKRGKLLIINNIKFANGKEVRKGAKLDECNAYELFEQLGFEIVKCCNLNKKALMKKVTEFRQDKSLNKVDIGAVLIMSHGTGRERNDSTEIACTDGEKLPTTWIINEFDNVKCPQLKGKPKIFIFQCCRGDQYDIVEYDGPPTTESRLLSDMLIGYATVPGFVAHRDPVLGTWYIQAICKVFMEHAHNTDVENLLKIVDAKLATLSTNCGSRQTTSFENRGFKTCYLHPQLWEN